MSFQDILLSDNVSSRYTLLRLYSSEAAVILYPP